MLDDNIGGVSGSKESNRKRTCGGSQAVAISPFPTKKTRQSYSNSGCISVGWPGVSAHDAQLTKDNMSENLRKKQDAQLTEEKQDEHVTP